MSHSPMPLAILSLVLLAAAAPAQFANPVYDAQRARAEKEMPANRAKVQAAMKEAGLPSAPLVWYSVPAMSDRMRLQDSYPEDGTLAGELRAVLAQGEFEPASFVLFSFADQKDVTLAVGPLKGPDGATIPTSDLDLRVVKLWFQCGNGWTSYFWDDGLMLVPELMLHDEKMVRVDLRNAANYARLKEGKGERFVWISSPKDLDSTDFDPVNSPFQDADTLQPVDLDQNAFKQFVLTVHAAKDQRPGTYRGTVKVARGGTALAEIPVAVRVLPFALPEPRPYHDLDGYFIVSFMSLQGQGSFERMLKGDKERAAKMYREYLVNLRDHGVAYPTHDQDERSFALLRELGMPTKPVMMGRAFTTWYALNFGGRMSFGQWMAARRGAKQCVDYYEKLVGHHDVLASYGDEQGTAFVTAHRPMLREYKAQGIKMGCAGHDPLLFKGGYLWDIHPAGSNPDRDETYRPWAEIGGKYLGFYACQHNGSENPQYVRRQHGLLGYFTGLNMVFNYEFAVGPWNDLRGVLYKPMVVAYMNAGGLVETLAWSGFREGIDDIKYATCLKQLCAEAKASDSAEARIEAEKALQWMALLPRQSMDLNTVRIEMISNILKLRALLGKDGK